MKHQCAYLTLGVTLFVCAAISRENRKPPSVLYTSSEVRCADYESESPVNSFAHGVCHAASRAYQHMFGAPDEAQDRCYLLISCCHFLRLVRVLVVLCIDVHVTSSIQRNALKYFDRMSMINMAIESNACMHAHTQTHIVADSKTCIRPSREHRSAPGTWAARGSRAQTITRKSAGTPMRTMRIKEVTGESTSSSPNFGAHFPFASLYSHLTSLLMCIPTCDDMSTAAQSAHSSAPSGLSSTAAGYECAGSCIVWVFARFSLAQQDNSQHTGKPWKA